MPPFTLDISSPIQSGSTGTNGGPLAGGHNDPNESHWFNRFGMDLSAPVTTKVVEAFDAHVTRYNPHDTKNDTPKSYGAQIFARSPNDKMGVFYQHLTSISPTIAVGATIKRGDPLGEVYIIPRSGMPPHLHWALVDIVDGKHIGVDIFKAIFPLRNTTNILKVTFQQNGQPPTST